MSRSDLVTANIVLAWSVWTELGIPGVERNHRNFVLDLEPIVLWSPSVVLADPRLRDLVFRWCREHGDRLSASRLRGLLRDMPAATTEPYGRFAHALNSTSSLRWPGALDLGDPWPIPTEQGSVPLPMGRPALLRLRLRALSGVGTRADVLGELLADADRWTTAADLADLGYTKRNVARVLAELEAAGIARSRARGNSRHFRLDAPGVLARLAGSESLPVPRWFEALKALALVADLAERLDGRSPAVCRVEAHKLRAELDDLTSGLGLPALPMTSGNPEAYEDLLEWAADSASACAHGSATALERR
jgi:DNA-binding transcriptional ArsR family regulator